MEMFADGRSLGKDGNWKVASTFVIPGDTRVVSVLGRDTGVKFGILGSFSNGLLTDESWKCSSNGSSGWNFPYFDDSPWPHAVVGAQHGDSPWRYIQGIAKPAKWIWTAGGDSTVYCRLNLP